LSPAPWFTIVLVALSTAATVIASQALITGVFSLSRQAIQLGLFPRLTIKHTSEHHEGQIYVPIANWLLAVASIGLVVVFKSSTGLASAYVLAIAGTMLVTTIAFHRVCIDKFGWSKRKAGVLLVGFSLMDGALLASTSSKLFDGGWVPVLLASLVLGVMLVWRLGRRLLHEYVDNSELTWDDITKALKGRKIPRTEGDAVVLAAHDGHVPQALASSVRLLHAVPKRILVLTIETAPVPTVPFENRFELEDLGSGIAQVVASIGFAETPDIPRILVELASYRPELSVVDPIYYLSDRHFLATNAGRMGRVSESIFSFLHRNAARPAQFFNLPDDRCVTLASHLDL
jgi:KUP system potassium uptake protein